MRRPARPLTPLALGLAVLVAAAAAPAASRLGGPPLCPARSLIGAFSLVPGSPGAGNVVYVLRLRNRTESPCFVSGLPSLQLLRERRQPLPTHAVAAHPGQLTEVRVVLSPGAYASASGRFSPDVPGVGEQRRGACEPKAFFLRVRGQGGGSLLVPVRPPTSVCEHGGVSMTAFVSGRRVPS